MTTAQATLIRRATNGLRNWSHDGHEIAEVVFYGDGQVYLRSRSGWLEHTTFDPTGQPYSYTSDVIEIEVAPVALARKENLTRTDNYVLTSKAATYGSERKRYVLYLYLPEPPRPLGEFVTIDAPQSKTYTSFVEVPLRAVINRYKSLGDDQYAHLPDPLQAVAIASGYRTETTDFGTQVAATIEEFKAKGLTINSYEVGQLLAHYTLTPRQPPTQPRDE